MDTLIFIIFVIVDDGGAGEADEQVLLAYHIEQAEGVEEASLSVVLPLLHHLLLLRPPPPHLRFGLVRSGLLWFAWVRSDLTWQPSLGLV